MAEYESDALARLVRAKRDCLLQLRELGQRQLPLIDAGDMTTLLDLLAVKQRYLAKLQQIERALDPFRGQDPERRQWRTPEARAECAADLKQCESLLAEIVDREQRGEGALRARRDETARQLQGAYFSGQARGAYAPQPREQTHLLDLHCEQ
jgi:hypothetical protein